MSIVETQIRTDRFCELVKAELNSRGLPSPTLDKPAELAGKLLEKIECVSCSLAAPSAGSGVVIVGGDLAFGYHTTLADVHAAGSLQASATQSTLLPFTVRFTIALDPSLPQPLTLKYDVLLYGLISAATESLPLDTPADLTAKSAAIEASAEVVTIRIGTTLDDPVNAPPINRIDQGEWIQLIPGEFIADTVQRILDRALDEAVMPPPPPDPNKPWLPQPKPQELRKDEPARAAWVQNPAPAALGTGDLVAVNACPLLDVDISIELSLSVGFDFPAPDAIRTTAVLTWDADSTWCDVLATLLLGIPFGIGFHVAAEDAVSDAVLGKSLSPGDGFAEVGRTDRSITFQRVAWTSPPPSREFVRSHSEVTAEGLATGGIVRPKKAPDLSGELIPATSALHIDCNLRAVSMVFNPAQVILRNRAAGYVGRPPRVFVENSVFVPVDAWTIRTDLVDMSDPHSTSPQTVLTFIDPPTGRLPAGTPTSVFLFTDFGVRWVDLGEIPEVPKAPPNWATRLMNDYCGSISNPWARGMTRLGWIVDPLVDPDYAHRYALDPVRLWTVGLRELPVSARIEFVAVAPDGSERSLGIVEGQRSAALQLVTDANETLGIRSTSPFSAPAPTVSRSWMFPFAAHPLGAEPVTMASAGCLLGVTGRDGATRILDPRDVGETRMGDQPAARRSDPRHGRVGDALAREEARGRHAWATATRLDKNTVAVTHRSQVLIGTVGISRRVQ